MRTTGRTGFEWRRATQLLGPSALFAIALVVATAVFVERGAATNRPGDLPVLDEVEQRALTAQATLRISAVTCDGLVRGSGFVVGDRLLTNRHLLVGTATARADQPIAPVSVVVTGRSPSRDLAVLSAPRALSLGLARRAVVAGEEVLVGGHDGGGAIEVRSGSVVGIVDGTAYGLADQQVLLVDAVTGPGFSGGPVVDRHGQVVGMLQGFEERTGLTLAIPSLDLLAELDGVLDDSMALNDADC